MKKQITGIFTLIILTSCGNNENVKIDEKDNEKVYITDKEGNEYSSIVIGKQEWLKENLNTSKFSNGDVIIEAKTNEEWINACENKKAAWHYYNFNIDNGERYGKLYNWYAVIDERNLAPKEWHIPTKEEWSRLSDFLGGEKVAGEKLKFTDYWAETETKLTGNGNNKSGFKALPGGSFTGNYQNDQLGIGGYWWTKSTMEDLGKTYLWVVQIINSENGIYQFNAENIFSTKIPLLEAIKNPFFVDGYSVRCIKD